MPPFRRVADAELVTLRAGRRVVDAAADVRRWRVAQSGPVAVHGSPLSLRHHFHAGGFASLSMWVWPLQVPLTTLGVPLSIVHTEPRSATLPSVGVYLGVKPHPQRLYVAVRSDTFVGVHAPNDLAPLQWVHVSVALVDSHMTAYVNGQVIGQLTVPVGAPAFEPSRRAALKLTFGGGLNVLPTPFLLYNATHAWGGLDVVRATALHVADVQDGVVVPPPVPSWTLSLLKTLYTTPVPRRSVAALAHSGRAAAGTDGNGTAAAHGGVAAEHAAATAAPASQPPVASAVFSQEAQPAPKPAAGSSEAADHTGTGALAADPPSGSSPSSTYTTMASMSSPAATAHAPHDVSISVDGHVLDAVAAAAATVAAVGTPPSTHTVDLALSFTDPTRPDVMSVADALFHAAVTCAGVNSRKLCVARQSVPGLRGVGAGVEPPPDATAAQWLFLFSALAPLPHSVATVMPLVFPDDVPMLPSPETAVAQLRSVHAATEALMGSSGAAVTEEVRNTFHRLHPHFWLQHAASAVLGYAATVGLNGTTGTPAPPPEFGHPYPGGLLEDGESGTVNAESDDATPLLSAAPSPAAHWAPECAVAGWYLQTAAEKAVSVSRSSPVPAAEPLLLASQTSFMGHHGEDDEVATFHSHVSAQGNGQATMWLAQRHYFGALGLRA